MTDLPPGRRSAVYWKLEELEQELRGVIGRLDVREREERNTRNAADGSIWRRLTADVLEPARLERMQPLSRFASTFLPNPAKLRGRDWVAEVYECPADVVALSGGLEANVRLLQRAGDEMQILAGLLGVKPRDTAYFNNVWKPALAAIDTQTAAEGQEFVPTVLSGRVVERVGAGLVVGELFGDPGVMTSDPFSMPGFAVIPGRPSLHPEQFTDAGQIGIGRVTPGTRAVTLDASKLGATALVSTDLVEDTVVLLLAAIEVELGDWLSAGVDDAIINGDTSATHQDADVTTSADARKAWPGLRKLALAGTKTDGGNAILTAAMLRTNRKKMGRYGGLPGQLAHIVSAVAAAQLTGDPAFVTVEQFGPHRAPVDGEAGSIDGVPVVISDYVRSDLNAAGNFDGITANRSEAITVNRRAFVLGSRRGVSVQRLEEIYAPEDQRGVKATLRMAFASAQPATATTIAVTYNLATT